MANKSVNSKSVKKEGWGQKCANYLDLPVCPNCGSPNLHELEKRGNVTNCICDRCDTKCWFDDSFSTEGRETVRFTDNLKIIESAKKSKFTPKSFNDMVKKQREKNQIKKDDEISIEEYRQINIEALQMMIDTLEEAIDSIESTDDEALWLLNSKLASGLGGGHYGMFLLGGSEAELDEIIEKMRKAIEFCKTSQTDYENGEYDW